MIKLQFLYNREMLFFLVKQKEIYYTDRKWGHWIKCLPVPANMEQMIKMSRNRIPASILNLFSFNEEEKKQYENASGEEELAEIIILDAKTKGCNLVNRIKEDG